jgi:hypothetical protein
MLGICDIVTRTQGSAKINRLKFHSKCVMASESVPTTRVASLAFTKSKAPAFHRNNTTFTLFVKYEKNISEANSLDILTSKSSCKRSSGR